jgi:hypothetical protein
VSRIKKAVELGYKVTITCCVHNRFVERDEDGNFLLDTMIRFAESLGIAQINFHDLFKVGVPMDTWTGNLNPSIEEWVSVFEEIRKDIDAGKYKISVRLPQCFIKKEEFERDPEYYGYCPVKLGERVMVHPNSIIRICSNLICSPFHIANYYDNKIVWDRTGTNEMLDHKLNECTPCTNRSKNKSYGDYVPLCFSFKPKQDEIICHENLNWESRRKD